MKHLLIALLILTGPLALAQNAPDKIQKKDKTVVDAVVLEISKNEIQYKKFSSPKGATYTMPTSEVASIVYASGYIDVMASDAAPSGGPVVKNTTVEPQATPPPAVRPEETPASEDPAAEPVAKAEKKERKAKPAKEKPARKEKKQADDAQADSRGDATASADESKTTVTKLDGRQESVMLPSSDFTGLDIDRIPKSGLEKDERLPAEYAGEYQWKSSDRGGRETAWLFEWDNVTLIAKEWMGYGWRVHSNNPKDIKLDGNKLTVKKKVLGHFVHFNRSGQEVRGFQPMVDKKAKKDGRKDMFLIKVS